MEKILKGIQLRQEVKRKNWLEKKTLHIYDNVEMGSEWLLILLLTRNFKQILVSVIYYFSEKIGDYLQSKQKLDEILSREKALWSSMYIHRFQ